MRRVAHWTALFVTMGVLVLSTGVIWAQEAAPAPAAGTEKQTLLWLIKQSGMIGYVIIAFSAAMLALIFINIMNLRRSNLIPENLVVEVDELLRNKQAKAALELCQNDPSLTGKMMAAGISRMPRGYDQAMEYMGEVGAEGAMKFQHNVSYLSIIGAVAPMMGLLGTVVGMVGAFRDLSLSGGQPNPSAMAGNIQLALMTTVEGLIVAIPAVFAYALLKNRLAMMLTEVDMVTAELMGRFQGIMTPLRGVAPRTAPSQVPQPPQQENPSA